jgi:sodium/hydrogen exchanger-like protein 6/7
VHYIALHWQLFGYALIGLDNDEGSRFTDIQQKVTFDSELFFFIILPPIIFHAGYSMRKKQFFDNLGSILTFALFGTLISTMIIASIMWLIAKTTSLEVHFLDTLYFGAIVSATDPVTILAIFQDLHVDPLMNSLVLGESLLNDAIVIVLCGAIEDYSRLIVDGEPDSFQVGAFLLTIVNFFTILLGSVGLGALLGAATALLTKFTRIRDFQLLETGLFFLLSYSSYLIADICQASGIVSILFCGIFQVFFGKPLLSYLP